MLRARLFLNLLPFAAILLALGIYAMVLFSHLAGSVNRSFTQDYRSVLAAQQMNLAVAGMEKGLLLVLEGNESLGQAIFDDNQQRFEQELNRQRHNLNLAQESALTASLQTNYQAFHHAGTNLLAMPEFADRRRIYEQQVIPQLLSAQVLLEQISALNHDAILEGTTTTANATRQITALMIVGLLAAFVVTSFACYQVGRSILVPIRSLTDASKALGDGNLDQIVPVRSRDELGQLAKSFNKMAAQLRAYRESTTEEILQLHHTMETTLATFPDPIFVVDRAGAVQLKNAAAVDLLRDLRANDDLPEPLRQMAHKVLSGGADYLPNHFDGAISLRIGGQDRCLLPRILAMRDSDHHLVGVIAALYDISRFRLMDDVKTNLIATISHELKTPLTTVRLVLHTLLESTFGTLTDRQRELIETARADSERLLHLLNDLLDFNRLEAQNPELKKEKITPSALVSSVVREMLEKVSAKGLTLQSEVDPDLPLLTVDAQRIQHALTNFVINAIEYSPPAADILIRARRAPDAAVRFSVLDRGPGLGPKERSRVFDRFFRGKGTRNAGAGLGLSIAREIVVAHGGRVGVESEPGAGCEFYLVLEAEAEGTSQTAMSA